MIIYPAIDIKEGKCVRLLQGKAESQTIYSENPLKIAIKWAELGARYLHVVDLDGAFQGYSSNLRIIKDIVEQVPVPIQLGGGIRSLDKVSMLLEEIGVKRVIIGTAAIENPEFLNEIIKRYKERIVIGIDARDGKVAIKGWNEQSNISAIDLGKKMSEIGAQTVIYTDISRDGMLKGPNITATRDIIQQTGLNIIASGGVAQLDDIKDVKATGATGVIVGKALYTNSIYLPDALKLEEE